MTTEQTILFTVMPRGISINRDPLPLSVFIAPRLGGADKLGAFADWLRWTRNLKEAGLELELRCGANTFTTAIDPTPLRPELWEQLFNEGTLVRSHTFDDYTDRGMISFSVRQSLSAIKSIYQNASVNLALPEKPEDHGRDNEIGNRAFLRDLVNGLQVNWNGDAARNWREAVRRMNTSDRFAYSQQALSGPLDQEGLITS
ncbi:MAG TPA: hypothetical protein VKC60_04100, partial [Opitutaceae bacterium]|nr:hypothetical protein [Opitutaceae bacterium]